MSDSTSAIGAVSASSAANTSSYYDHLAPSVSNKTQNDLVTLSPTAQAVLLSQQGLSASEIAQVLSLPISAVQEELGIAIASTQTKAAGA